MKLNLGMRINILILFLILALIAINPKFNVEGVEIKSVKGVAKDNGIEGGEIVKEINNVKILDPAQFKEIIKKETNVSTTIIHIKTDKSDVSYEALDSLKFELNNLTIRNSEIKGVSDGEILKEINGHKINDVDDFEEIRYELLETKKLEIKTNKKSYAFLTSGDPGIDVKEVSKNNIKKGLDLEGGTRVLLKPVGEEKINSKDIENLIAVLRNRLNVYGLTDLKIREASSGNDRFVLIEIAGIDKEEIKDFVAKQGKFEAKIGNESVFIGGKKDIPFVCKDDGTCSGVRRCGKISEKQYSCRFEFSIKLSKEAAERHANVTKDLDIINEEGGNKILSKQIEFYLDNKLIDSLNIDADLKGSETTDILISGPGFGVSEAMALEDALGNMEKLQTVLITGSLPFRLEIAKIDSISPIFGKRLIKNAFFTGLIAMIAVLLSIFVRYRNLKVLLPMTFILISELILVLGVAAAIGWNIDIAAIAGMVASIGTGVDDQIVITDEVLKGKKEVYFSWKDRIKKAFFIIFIAYATTFVAMIPLWGAAAGLLRGFAVTTIIGISIGVFITRPAFASILERLIK